VELEESYVARCQIGGVWRIKRGASIVLCINKGRCGGSFWNWSRRGKSNNRPENDVVFLSCLGQYEIVMEDYATMESVNYEIYDQDHLPIYDI